MTQELTRRWLASFANSDIREEDVHASIDALVANIRAKPEAVAKALNKKVRAQTGGNVTPMPQAFYDNAEEASYLTGAPGESSDQAPFPTTITDDTARAGLEQHQVGGSHIVIPRAVSSVLKPVLNGKDLLLQGLSILRHRLGKRGRKMTVFTTKF